MNPLEFGQQLRAEKEANLGAISQAVGRGGLYSSGQGGGLQIPPGGMSGLSSMLKRTNISPPSGISVPGMGQQTPQMPQTPMGQAGQGMGQYVPQAPTFPVKNDIGDMLRMGFANEGGRMNTGMGGMAMKTSSRNKVAGALVAMAVAELEKEAGGLAGLAGMGKALGSLARTAPAAIASGAKMIGNAGKFVNTGSKNLLRATGNVLQGGGQVGSAVGGLAGRVGRFGQQVGSGVINAAGHIPTNILGTNAGRPIRDAAQAVGHGVRAMGSAVSGTGGGVGLAGKGLNMAGQGLKSVSQMGGAIPTLAAAPVAVGAAMAAKPFVPNVGLQNPIANMNANFRSPVTVNWDKQQ